MERIEQHDENAKEINRDPPEGLKPKPTVNQTASSLWFNWNINVSPRRLPTYVLSTFQGFPKKLNTNFDCSKFSKDYDPWGLSAPIAREERERTTSTPSTVRFEDKEFKEGDVLIHTKLMTYRDHCFYIYKIKTKEFEQPDGSMLPRLYLKMWKNPMWNGKQARTKVRVFYEALDGFDHIRLNIHHRPQPEPSPFATNTVFNEWCIPMCGDWKYTRLFETVYELTDYGVPNLLRKRLTLYVEQFGDLKDGQALFRVMEVPINPRAKQQYYDWLPYNKFVPIRWNIIGDVQEGRQFSYWKDVLRSLPSSDPE